MNIGEKIDYLRDLRGWTRKKLSQRVGVTEGTLSHAVTGKNLPEWRTIVGVADAYEMTLEELMADVEYDDMQLPKDHPRASAAQAAERGAAAGAG